MSGNIFGSLIDSVKEVFSNPQVLAQGVKDGNIARTGNTEYFIDGKDSFHNMKDAEAASGRWQKRAQDELIGLATIGIGKTAQGLYKGAQTANTVNKGIYLGGKTQPLLGMSKSLPATRDRGDIRQGMRANGINPYDYSGSDRKQLKTYLNNPTTDNYTQSVSKIIGDGKIQQNMLNNAVQNQTSQYQLTKPNLGYNPSQNNQLVNLKFEKGGQMYKYSAGAQMVQPQQASGQQGIEQQAMTLVQAAMQGDQQANQTIQKIMQAAQQGDQQAAQVAKLLQAIVQQMKGSRKARLGAKLDYIKQSIGECPEGQEVVYFKKGGEICKICAGKKMQDGGKSDPIKNFKKKKDVAKQTYQRNPYTRGKSAKEIAEMQRRNRQEASAGKGENDANVAPWNYKKKKMK